MIIKRWVRYMEAFDTIPELNKYHKTSLTTWAKKGHVRRELKDGRFMYNTSDIKKYIKTHGSK